MKSCFKNFQIWLTIWEKHEVSLILPLSSKPADPEEICKWLVRYGQDMFLAGKSYGAFSETIHAIGVARPLIRKPLSPAQRGTYRWLLLGSRMSLMKITKHLLYPFC